MKPLNFSLLTFIKLSTASFLLCFSLILPVQAEETATTTDTNIPVIVETATTTTPTSTPETPEPELPTIKIHLQIEAFDQTLYNDDLEVEACLSAPDSAEPTLNAWCAIEQIAADEDWTINHTTFGDAKFLSAINNYNGVDFNWWAFFHNFDFATEALNQYVLSENDHILLSYGTFPLKIEADDASPLLNSTSTVKAYSFGFDPSSWAPVWTLSPSTTIVINDQEFLSNDGTREFLTNHYGPYNISAKKTGFISSASIIIAPQLPTANIHLQIAGLSANLYNQNLMVTACEETPESGNYTLNGLCAIKQTGLDNDWNYFGTDAFLNSIGDIENNQNDNFIYWMWFVDLKDGQVALNKHLLNSNENLLLTYGRNPLRINASVSTTLPNTTFIISLEEFGFDSSWNAVWLPAVSSTLLINGQEINNDTGNYELLATTTTPYIIYGKKSGYLDSSTITITGQEALPSEPTTEIEQPTPPPASSGGGGGYYAPTHDVLDTNKAMQYLLANQNADGSIGSTLYSDWSAIALAAAGQNNEALKNYLLFDPSAAGGLNEVSDSARRAMALMALGINPYNGTKTNYIQKITDTFDGTQFGDKDLYNDDIFALFPLLHAGYTVEDGLITSTVKFVLSKQNPNGAWDGVDMTAATIQALSQIKNIEGVENALNKAKEFLRNQQQSNGGWGNTFSTSWANQALAALGENQSNWEKNNKNPNDYIYTQQNILDGGLEKDSVVTSTRLWATSYAIPAALGKTWPQILNHFTKPTNATAEVNGVGGYYPETMATSTTSSPTSTSTLLAVVTPTSTPIVAPEIIIEPTEPLTTAVEKIKTIAPKNENASQPVTENTVKENNKDEQNESQLSAAPASAEDNTETIINALPLDTPTRRTAKKVAAATGGGALVIGLYLGLRILKNVV